MTTFTGPNTTPRLSPLDKLVNKADKLPSRVVLRAYERLAKKMHDKARKKAAR